MAMLGRGKAKEAQPETKVLDVTASMQGSLVFREPVSLRISGKFEGTLETRGELMIGESAQVRADITGETITVAGRVEGKLVAQQSLKVIPPAVFKGEIWTPVLEVGAGAQIQGTIHMGGKAGPMSLQEVAEYLEVEGRTLEQWAREGRIPAAQEAGQWRFEKTKIDEWVATQKSS